MNKTFKVIAAVALTAFALCAALPANAQGGGGGGRQGGGRQGGGFGMSNLMLASRNDVGKDLNLSSDQKDKIKALSTDQRAKMQEMFQGGGGGGDRQAMMENLQKMNKEYDSKLNDILNADQQKRLKQISLQIRGAGAYSDPEIQKDLGFTDDQKAKIKDLTDKQQEANAALRQKVQSGELDQAGAAEARKKNADTLNSEVAKVLTDDQKKKLADMMGKKFELDPNEPMGGRRGGGGGGL